MDQTAALRDLGGQRVWSLMVSLFGDLAQGQGQVIEGPLLRSIMDGLDIKPEATRVALHRLRKDGWLQSEKSGRISRHSLTPEGSAQSTEASPRIYADPSNLDADWQVALLPASDLSNAPALVEFGFSPIAPRIFVGRYASNLPEGVLALSGEKVPDWLKEEVKPTSIEAGYTALLETLRGLRDSLAHTPPKDVLEVAVLRCLIVHNWRRLVLKHPALPKPLVDPTWVGHLCHLIVWDLLSQHPAPSIADLDKHHAEA